MDGLIIGLDLCDDRTQLNCYEKEESWNIPTVVCRKKDSEEWFVGEDAYARTLMGEGVIVDKLLKLVQKDGTSTIGGVRYTGDKLLEAYLCKVLEYPYKEFACRQVDQLTISLREVNAKLIDVLTRCAAAAGIDGSRLHIISHTESFAYFVLSQKKDLWTNQVGMFELASERLCYYEMKVQRGMRKNVVQAESAAQEEAFSLDILESLSGTRLADRILTTCGERLLQKKLFSSIFLTGKGFEKQDWAPDFMKLICNRRRVYGETGVFSKGAAYRAADCMRESTAYPYTFICEGRLKAEVSMKVVKKGRESRLVVASYGDNWYESQNTMEFILDGQREVEFLVTPLDPKKKKLVRIPLEGFPQRPDKTTRIEMNVEFLNENTMITVIRDKGFGELFPASDAVVRQEVLL